MMAARSSQAWAPSFPKSSGKAAGATIPIAAKAAIASAFRPAYQAGWQRECSQTLPSVPIPKGNRGSRGCSPPPQPKQLSCRRAHGVAVQPFGKAPGDGTGFGLFARQQAIQFADVDPLVEEDLPVLGRPTVPARQQQPYDLGLVTRQQIEHNGRRRRARFQHQIVAVDTEFVAAGAGHPQCVGRAHAVYTFGGGTRSAPSGWCD